MYISRISEHVLYKIMTGQLLEQADNSWRFMTINSGGELIIVVVDCVY